MVADPSNREIKRKYISEFCILANGNWTGLLQQSDFESLRIPYGYDPHIYIIARHPRIFFDPKSLKIEKETFSGIIFIQKPGHLDKVEFSERLSVGEDAKIECPYPHTIFEVKGGKKWFKMRAANFISFLDPPKNFLDLEVLYVGQAYGNDGEGTIQERIVKHSTLQSIYSKTIDMNPDQEVWIILCSFDINLLISMDGITKAYTTTSEEDEAHTKMVLNAPISEQQEVNFVEAAMIRYFEPEYNKIFKNTFPNPAHSTYKQCYDLDLNSIAVTIDTESIKARLYSRKAVSEPVHSFDFPLHSKKERKYMFDF